MRSADSTAVAPIRDTSDGGLVTIAGTGAGKGVSQVIPTLLTYPGSIIVNDPKGEVSAVTERRRRDMGQQVFHLDPFGREDTHALNPFSVIRPFSAEAPDQCAALAARLLPKSEAPDPFWENTARHLIAGTCLFIATYLSPEFRHLGTLGRIWAGGESRLSEFLAVMKRCTHYDGAVRDAAAIYEDAPDKTRTSMLTSIREPLAFLASPRGRKSLSGNEIPPALIESGTPVTIYLRVPPHLISGQAALLRVWIGTLIAILASRKVRPVLPDLLLIDEAAQLGQLEELLVAASLLRGYGVRTWSFWQSVGQMEGIWGPRHREFLDNASVLSVFGAGNAAAASAASDLTGLPFEDLLGLSPDLQALSMSGSRPKLCRRIDYRTDPSLAAMADPNPLHEGHEWPTYLQKGDIDGR
ncbi:type IV secretory system conjugative DNA transfer family protein [Ruegeria intermedia]|nr:type IV secretory system conjugative DNA transfer family protein [Ruegeria intermedia]